MPVKRRASKRRSHQITDDLRPVAERVVALMEAHTRALTDTSDEAQLFYTDGRHQELVDALPLVTLPLEIEPHEDAEAALRAMLRARPAGDTP